jgi:hypothetical protein
MPRFYFHLSKSDEFSPDTIGTDVSDLAAAHFRALQVVDCVISFSGLAGREPDWRRWAVHITDQMQQPVVTLIFSACLMAEKRIAITKQMAAMLPVRSLPSLPARSCPCHPQCRRSSPRRKLTNTDRATNSPCWQCDKHGSRRRAT